MVRIFVIGFLIVQLSGCAAMRIRVVDEATGLPIANKNVSATPLGIFPLGMPDADVALTDAEGIASLRNRRLDSSIISVDGLDAKLGYDEILDGSDRTSNGTIRVEYVGSAIGWPFRKPSRIAR